MSVFSDIFHKIRNCDVKNYLKGKKIHLVLPAHTTLLVPLGL